MTQYRMLLASSILLFFAGATAAQELDKLKDTTPEQRARVETELMKSRLALTNEQLPEVRAINLKYAQKMDPVIKSAEGPLQKLRQAREIGEAKDAELKQVFSGSQYQKYLDSKEQMRQRIEQKLMEKAQGGKEAGSP